MDKDGNELDGEGSRPQKHAKSPELARDFLLDAATVIFKEQVISSQVFCVQANLSFVQSERLPIEALLPILPSLLYSSPVKASWASAWMDQNTCP